MICPRCRGERWVETVIGHAYGSTYSRPLTAKLPCDYPGCHAGQVACCDGLCEQPSTEREHD